MSDPQPSPTPATPLNYSHAASYHGRPGIITAVGVMSIIVACLSGLASLWGGFRSGMYYYVSTQPTAAFTTTTTPVTPPPPPPGTAPTPAPPPQTAPPALTATPATTAPATAPAATKVTIVHSHSVSYSGVGGLGGGFVATTTAPTTAPVGAPAAAAAPPAMANPFGRINPLAAILAIVTELLSLALAVLLLVAAIQILRDAPSGPRLHRWYALAKIPLVIVGTAVGLWLTFGMMRSIMASMGPAGGGAAGQQSAFMWSFMAVQTIVPALLALAYPVALLIILRSRAVREYYNAVRDDGAPPPDSFDSRAG